MNCSSMINRLIKYRGTDATPRKWLFLGNLACVTGIVNALDILRIISCETGKNQHPSTETVMCSAELPTKIFTIDARIMPMSPMNKKPHRCQITLGGIPVKA